MNALRKILIVGGTSAIAEHVARGFAAQGARLYLLGRDTRRLEAICADLKLRGAEAAGFGTLDVNDVPAHPAAIAAAVLALDGLDAALIAHGTLPDQAACQESVTLTLREISTNGTSVIALATELALRFESEGHGTLAVISSPAGDRGRASNYVYGAAKAMVTAFTSGLRARLADQNVRVVTIKPGFVDTPMTAAFPKGPLWAQPADVGARIVRAMERGERVVYVPGFWRWIMFAIRAIPESVFAKLKRL